MKFFRSSLHESARLPVEDQAVHQYETNSFASSFVVDKNKVWRTIDEKTRDQIRHASTVREFVRSSRAETQFARRYTSFNRSSPLHDAHFVGQHRVSRDKGFRTFRR